MIHIPEAIEKKMRGWRKGFNSLPQEYIDFHKNAAEKSLATDFAGYIIHRQYMNDDGWCDGMKLIHVIVEKAGKLLKLKWSDTGYWYDQCPSGGWGLYKVGED